MSVTDELRKRAERLLALALKAREHSDGNDAEELEHLAAKALADADLIERGSGCPVPPAAAALQQLAQHHRQPQTRDPEKAG